MGAGMAWDPGSGRMVLFGGITEPDSSDQRYAYDDTWEWTGRRWEQKFPAVHPPARNGVVMVTDQIRERVILFGGAAADNQTFSDTWSYTQGVWRLLNPPASPPPRRYAGGTYDPATDRIIIYGGVAGEDEILTDTWEFDGTTWRQLAAAGPQLTGPTLVIDEDSGELLLVGVEITGGTFEGRTYRWSGTEWVRLEPATQPRCVAQTGMVWQQHNGDIVLHGGACPSGAMNPDTFKWTGSDWSKVTTTGTAGIVFGHSMAYDPLRQEILLFGGTDLAARSSTYRYRDGRWTIELTAGAQPGARSLFVFETATFDGVTSHYLFGGLETGLPRSDLWRLDGNIWRRVSVEGGPTACSYPAGAFDAARSRLVIVCEDRKVWEFSGSAWKENAPPDDGPTGRRWASVEYDPVRKNIVMFGGYDFPSYLNETWTWNGTRWTEVEQRRNAPFGRALTSMFWDPINQKMTIFGGIGRETDNDRIERLGDMWVFNGTQWTEVTPASLPPIRYGASVVWDPTRGTQGAAVMFGGKSEKEIYLNDEWQWNGSTWTQVQSANPPSARMNAGMVFDADSMAVIHYGGYAGRYFAELYWLKDGAWTLIPPRERGRRGVPRPGIGADGLTPIGRSLFD